MFFSLCGALIVHVYSASNIYHTPASPETSWTSPVSRSVDGIGRMHLANNESPGQLEYGNFSEISHLEHFYAKLYALPLRDIQHIRERILHDMFRVSAVRQSVTA